MLNIEWDRLSCRRIYIFFIIRFSLFEDNFSIVFWISCILKNILSKVLWGSNHHHSIINSFDVSKKRKEIVSKANHTKSIVLVLRYFVKQVELFLLEKVIGSWESTFCTKSIVSHEETTEAFLCIQHISFLEMSIKVLKINWKCSEEPWKQIPS